MNANNLSVQDEKIHFHLRPHRGRMFIEVHLSMTKRPQRGRTISQVVDFTKHYKRTFKKNSNPVIQNFKRCDAYRVEKNLTTFFL